MQTRTTSTLMAAFIGGVIVAGFFGPYGISLVIGGLSAICMIASL